MGTATIQKIAPFSVATSRAHMPGLDGLRAVAAFSVITLHSGYVAWLDGVTAFFVLSGFLITTLLIRELESTRTLSLRGFYARRTLRIFPAYYVCVASSLVIDTVAGNHWPPSLIQCAFGYVVNYYNAFHGHEAQSIAHLWSLGVEEQFYLLWPCLFLILARGGLRRVRLGLIFIIAASVLWKAVLHYKLGIGIAYLYNAFDARFDNLAIGCLLATLVGDRRTVLIASYVGRHWTLPLVTVAVSMLLLRLPSVPRHIFGFPLYAVLMALLIVQLLELHASRMWRWLDARPMVFLGTISYPTYLYHSWALGLAHWIPTESSFGRMLIGTAIAYIAATGSYYFIERPFLLVKARFGPKRIRPERSIYEASPVSSGVTHART